MFFYNTMNSFIIDNATNIIAQMPVGTTRDQIIDKLNELSQEETDRASIELEREEERRLTRKKRYYDFDNQYDEMKDLLATNLLE